MIAVWIEAAYADWDGGYTTCTIEGVYGYVDCVACAAGDTACTDDAAASGREEVCEAQAGDVDTDHVGDTVWCRTPTTGGDTSRPHDTSPTGDSGSPRSGCGCTSPVRRAAWAQAIAALAIAVGGGLTLRRREPLH